MKSSTTNTSVYPCKVNQTEPWDLKIVQYSCRSAECYKKGHKLGDVNRTRRMTWKMVMKRHGKKVLFESSCIAGVFDQVVEFYDGHTSKTKDHSVRSGPDPVFTKDKFGDDDSTNPMAFTALGKALRSMPSIRLAH